MIGEFVKQITWRLQANAAGGLTERARKRAEELARDSDLRLLPPREKAPAAEHAQPIATILLPPRSKRDGLPRPGWPRARLRPLGTLLPPPR